MLAVTGNSLSVWSTECGACGLAPHWNAEFLSSLLTSSCLDLCRDKNAVCLRVSSIIMKKEYERVPLQYQISVLAASCIQNGAHSQHVENWTGCSPQPWVPVRICLTSPGVGLHSEWACLNKILPMPKHEHFPRQAARLGKMWLTCTSVSATLVVQTLHCTQMEIKKLI